jgi:hypothetical protein
MLDAEQLGDPRLHGHSGSGDGVTRKVGVGGLL